MKKVYFVRHGKSSWDDPFLRDHDRPLKNRGKKDASLIANHLLGLKQIPDLIISSSATRAKQTAEFFIDVLNVEKVDYLNSLYHAGDSTVIDEINLLDDEYNSVMIFGHNPTFTSIINHFSNEYFGNVPTAGTFAVEFDLESWGEVSIHNGNLNAYWFPRDFK